MVPPEGFEPEVRGRGSAFPGARMASLYHGPDLIGQWACGEYGMRLADVRQRVPSEYKYGTYEIKLVNVTLDEDAYITQRDAILHLCPTARRIDVVLRSVSGDVLMSWRDHPPFLRLADLALPEVDSSYMVLKGEVIIKPCARIWMEGDDEPIELTLVKQTVHDIMFSLYLSMFRNDDRAYLFPPYPVKVHNKFEPTINDCLNSLLFHLEHEDDDGASALLAVLQEDLYHDHILRRDSQPVVQSTGLEGHMGHAKLIAWLGIDGHFQFRVPRGDFVLVDRPTAREFCAIKTAIHDILWARIAADESWELQ